MCIMISGHLRTVSTWLCLSLMPALLVSLALDTRIPVPGNSLHNDPDWYYLGNSLQLALGQRAYMMEHPGMPLYVAGAIFLWLKVNLFPASAEPDMLAEVFLHSPDYHQYLGNFGLALTSLVLFAYGLVLQRKYVPLWVAVACQGLFLWAPNGLYFAGRWMPEGVAILLGAAYGLFYLAHLENARGAASSAALGGFLGLVTAVKLNYFPFALLAVLRGWKGFLVSAATAGTVFGAFMLTLWPERAVWLPVYFFRMLVNDGVYGSGEPGQPGPGEMLVNLGKIGADHSLALQQLGWAAAIAVLAFFLSLRWKERRPRWVMLAGLVMVIMNVIGQAKHPAARYSLPIFVFVPSLVAAFWAMERAKWAKGIMALAVAGMVAGGARQAWTEHTNLSSEAEAVFAQEKEIERHLSARPECLHLFHDSGASYRISNFSANALAGGAFSERLSALYPRTWIYRIQDQTFFRYTGSPVGAARFTDVLNQAACVFFYVRSDLPEPFEHALFRARAWTSVFKGVYAELRYSEKLR